MPSRSVKILFTLNEKAENIRDWPKPECLPGVVCTTDPSPTKTQWWHRWGRGDPAELPKATSCSSHAACPLLQQLLCLWFYLVTGECGLCDCSFPSPSTVKGVIWHAGVTTENAAIKFLDPWLFGSTGTPGKTSWPWIYPRYLDKQKHIVSRAKCQPATFKKHRDKISTCAQRADTACTLLDPTQHLGRTSKARCSCITLVWEKLSLWPVDKNMPFLSCLIVMSWRKTIQIKMLELRHWQEMCKTRQSLLLTSYLLFSLHHLW